MCFGKEGKNKSSYGFLLCINGGGEGVTTKDKEK